MEKSDAFLISQMKNKAACETAFEEILQKYQRLIFHIARRYFKNHEDAMDASQDAAIKIFNGLPRVALNENGNLKAWICTITARTCLDTLRKKRPQTTELNEETFSALAPLPSAFDSAAANERTNEIISAINNLPNEHRIAIILRDIQGLSYDEISRALNVSLGTIKSRISRARANLQKTLK
jgi:RNA polymerase sigma-70 factor (ECF subfamily)